jgi:hypothetical protein
MWRHLRQLGAWTVNLLDRALARLAMDLFGHAFAGCWDCGAASVHLITWGPEATYGLHPTAWQRCRYCADRLLSDDEIVTALAQVGATWYYLPNAVFRRECLQGLAMALFRDRWPFFAPTAAANTGGR